VPKKIHISTKQAPNNKMSGRRNAYFEQQAAYIRQSTILRKNLGEWDLILRNPRGEDFPKMLGRLNAALNQTANMDKTIQDVLEHFVYLPKQSTANAQDIPFFLSTRLEATTAEDAANSSSQQKQDQSLVQAGDPLEVMSKYEERTAKLAAEYEEAAVRF
jgi:hypothetical protein